MKQKIKLLIVMLLAYIIGVIAIRLGLNLYLSCTISVLIAAFYIRYSDKKIGKVNKEEM